MRLLDFFSRVQRNAGCERSLLVDGAYLPDGASLFRVAGTLFDINNDALVELEDCRTLDLILLPAGSATGAGLRPVTLPR